jgi:hypothetical protein
VEFANNKISLAQLAAIAKDQGEPALRSGHLETIEKILQEHILMAGYYALKDSIAPTASPALAVNPFSIVDTFFVADADRDGRISIHELASFVSKNSPDGTSIDSAAVKLLHADMNKDGHISSDEYRAFADCKLDDGGHCVTKVYQTM